jgi:hypothetical protein
VEVLYKTVTNLSLDKRLSAQNRTRDVLNETGVLTTWALSSRQQGYTLAYSRSPRLKSWERNWYSYRFTVTIAALIVTQVTTKFKIFTAVYDDWMAGTWRRVNWYVVIEVSETISASIFMAQRPKKFCDFRGMWVTMY